MNQYILISKNPENWTNIFHSQLIFNTLTDAHLLQIVFMQKIKNFTHRTSKVSIILDELELDDFNLHNKLYSIAKYTGDIYGIKIIEMDSDNKSDILTDDIVNEIKELNNHIKDNSIA